jgi:GAF domain-containing protein
MDTDALNDLHDRCLAARQRFLQLAVRATPRARIQELAERLGLAVADEFTQVGEAELAYAHDLATFAAPPGRTCARPVRRRTAGPAFSRPVTAGTSPRNPRSP